MHPLEIDLLRSFVGIAEAGSFTGAGSRLGATQSAMSMRLKKLEDRLGRTLFERTPRSVVLTPFGEGFLADARRLLAVHDEMVDKVRGAEREIRLDLGFTEHMSGELLGAVMAHVRERMPGVRIALTLGLSDDLATRFEGGRFDAVVVRRIGGADPHEDAETLFRDDLVWCASPAVGWTSAAPVPLVAVAQPCGVCGAAVAALEGAGLAWTEAFTSRGVAAVQAALAAGFGIGAIGRSCMPPGTIELGPDDGLPELPPSEVAIVVRRGDRQRARAVAVVAEALRRAGPLSRARRPS